MEIIEIVKRYVPEYKLCKRDYSHRPQAGDDSLLSRLQVFPDKINRVTFAVD